MVADKATALPSVSLELGDVAMMAVAPETPQPTHDRASGGQLITQLQGLLHHWVLWSAVKSRWVIVGEWPCLCPCPQHPGAYAQTETLTRELRGTGSPSGS